MIKILVLIFSVASFAANEPVFIQGQQEFNKTKIRDFQAPNNQATKLATDQFLVETGNKNILANPSFEHSTFSTGWTGSTTGTFFEDVGNVIDGKKSAGFLLVARTMSLIQDSNTYSVQFADGVQGIATVRIKASNGATGIKVCSRQAGVTSTTNCVDVVANGKWGLYKVPTILGGTSNGISIASSGNITSVVYIDDAFVGVTDIAQVSSAIGPWTTGVCTSTWTVNATTACKYRQVGDTAEVQYRVTLTGAPNAATLTLSTPNGLTIDTSKEFSRMGSTGSFITDSSGPIYYPSFPYASSPTAIGVGYGTSSTGLNPSATVFNSVNNAAPMTFATGDEVVVTIKIPVTQFSNATSVYTSNNANFSSVSYAPTVTSFGAISSSDFKYSRDGENLLVNFSFSSGTHAASTGYFSLPSGLSIDFTKIPNNSPVGKLGSAATPTSGALVAYSTQPQRIYLCSDAVNITLCNNANAWANTNFFSGTIKVPILGWENSNIIIGQFNGLQTCTNTLACTDTFSAQITSTGTVVAGSENVDWLSGNCTNGSTGQYQCFFNTSIFTATPNCVANHSATLTYQQTLYTAGATSSSVSVVSGNNAAAANVAFNLVCQKQGADYIGKTAMAVASDQNLSTPGIVKDTLVRVDFAGATIASQCTTTPCTLYSQRGGNWITSITRASAGNYTINLNASYWSNPANVRCWVNPYNIAWLAVDIPSGAGVSTITSRQNTGTYGVVDTYGALFCEGERL